MPGALPMRGGAAAVEHAGFRQDVGAGADAGDADAAFCHGPHEGQRRLAGRRLPHPLAAGHDQCGDRRRRFEAARQHLDAGRTANRPRLHRQHLDRWRLAGEAGGDLERRDRPGGVQQLEIRKYQHADHGFGLCPETREIWHFGRKAIMADCAGQAKPCRQDFERSHHVRTASDRHRAVSQGNPARLHRTAAGIFQRAAGKNASDLETDRACYQRLGADDHADRQLRRLSAARRDLRARRGRHRRHDQ